MSTSKMARLSPLDSQNNGDNADEMPEVHVEVAGSIRHGTEDVEREGRRLTFDPRDLEDLEGLETDDLAGDLNPQEFLKLADRDPKMLYKVMAEQWTKELKRFEQSTERLKRACERKLETLIYLPTHSFSLF